MAGNKRSQQTRRHTARSLSFTLFFLSLFLLSSCSSMLERQYSTVEPHSSKFWESEAAGTLRAETYSDIVNDLLLLIGQHRENATLRLNNINEEPDGGSVLERAAMEIQQETPLGSYAVSYIIYTTQSQRGYDEANIQIGYRRSAEQIQAIVSATTPEAVYSLLETALREGRTELAVRIGYWTQNGREQVEADVARLRSDLELDPTLSWTIAYYPETGQVGLIEFNMNPPPEPPVMESGTEGEQESQEYVDGMEIPEGISEEENLLGFPASSEEQTG